ncbi:hypothetical protein SLEP1_g39783 [Rubroshorea leprosula]|uniref:Uncharacterized protein n=1 Tax=Rubroshorea leprosula TaxID=152421 RepID=A0AAV5L1P1_9ROSI|nr:hypothetical protein SLEP1_g39783 [Rubroshorea leprosula]
MRDYSEDPHYVSNLDINWDQISNVVEKLTDSNQYQGIGFLNFNDSEIDHWNELTPDVVHVVMHLEYVSDNVTWESLYPERIDQEEEFEVPTCPSYEGTRQNQSRRETRDNENKQEIIHTTEIEERQKQHL